MDGNNNWDPAGQTPADPAQPAPVADPNAGQQGGWTPPVDPANPTPAPEPAPVADPNAGGWTPEPTVPSTPVADPNAGQPAGQTWDQGQGGNQGTNQGGTV